MEQTLPFLLLLAAGQILRRLPGLPADTDRGLNLYVIYVALPALILLRVPGLSLSRELLVPVLMPWAVVAFSGLLVWGLSRLARWPREITGALLLLVPLGNTSFFGIPMVAQYFGDSGISYAILYDQFGSFLALATYGTVILAVYGGGASPRLHEILKRIVLFPPFLALVAALTLHGATLPAWLLSLLEMTARSLVPVVLVAIGLQMRLRMPAAELLPFASGLAIRLLVTPLIFTGLCLLTGLSGPAVQVALLETAMPPMVTAGALAAMAGLKPRLCSALVGFGIIASFLTLPLIHALLR